jgi:hypothetical protein
LELAQIGVRSLWITGFYGAIAKVVLGRRYDRKGTVCVTLEQCGFFYHVVSQIILNLASSKFLILNDVITSN